MGAGGCGRGCCARWCCNVCVCTVWWACLWGVVAAGRRPAGDAAGGYLPGWLAPHHHHHSHPHRQPPHWAKSCPPPAPFSLPRPSGCVLQFAKDETQRVKEAVSDAKDSAADTIANVRWDGRMAVTQCTRGGGGRGRERGGGACLWVMRKCLHIALEP